MSKCENCNCKQLKILTPLSKKRNKVERFFNRYNHLMEFIRTLLAVGTISLQIIILHRLTN